MNDIVVEARSAKFFIWFDRRFKFLNGDRGGLTLYFPPRGGDGDSIDFDDSGSVADHVQWNIFGLDSYGGEVAPMLAFGATLPSPSSAVGRRR